MVFAPMVGWDDSTVVGILQWSPASGEKVVECVQSGSVSEGQGTSYTLSRALVTMHIFCHTTWFACKMLRCYVSSLILYMYKCVVISKTCPIQTSVPDTRSKHCMACVHKHVVIHTT